MADDSKLQESIGKMAELITDLKGCLERFKDKPKLVLGFLEELNAIKLISYMVLKQTGIGKTVNGFRKCEGGVGELARSIVAKWKDLAQDAIKLKKDKEPDAVAEPKKDSAAINELLNNHYSQPDTVKIKQEKDAPVKHIKKEKPDKIKSESTKESTSKKEGSDVKKVKSEKHKHDKTHKSHKHKSNVKIKEEKIADANSSKSEPPSDSFEDALLGGKPVQPSKPKHTKKLKLGKIEDSFHSPLPSTTESQITPTIESDPSPTMDDYLNSPCDDTMDPPSDTDIAKLHESISFSKIYEPELPKPKIAASAPIPTVIKTENSNKTKKTLAEYKLLNRVKQEKEPKEDKPSASSVEPKSDSQSDNSSDVVSDLLLKPVKQENDDRIPADVSKMEDAPTLNQLQSDLNQLMQVIQAKSQAITTMKEEPTDLLNSKESSSSAAKTIQPTESYNSEPGDFDELPDIKLSPDSRLSKEKPHASEKHDRSASKDDKRVRSDKYKSESDNPNRRHSSEKHKKSHSHSHHSDNDKHRSHKSKTESRDKGDDSRFRPDERSRHSSQEDRNHKHKRRKSHDHRDDEWEAKRTRYDSGKSGSSHNHHKSQSDDSDMELFVKKEPSETKHGSPMLSDDHASNSGVNQPPSKSSKDRSDRHLDNKNNHKSSKHRSDDRSSRESSKHDKRDRDENKTSSEVRHKSRTDDSSSRSSHKSSSHKEHKSSRSDSSSKAEEGDGKRKTDQSAHRESSSRKSHDSSSSRHKLESKSDKASKEGTEHRSSPKSSDGKEKESEGKSHKSHKSSSKPHKSHKSSHKLSHKDRSVDDGTSSSSRKRKVSDDGGVDASDGQAFEDAMCGAQAPDPPNKKKPASLEQKIAKTVAKAPLPQSYLNDLPELLTDYKPLPKINQGFDTNKKKTDEAAELMFSDIKAASRSDAVYSGRKRGFSQMMSLTDLCIFVLGNHIDDIGYVGGVPFTILEPVLKKATARQLLTVEDYNHEFTQESDHLWKDHCLRDFKGQKPDEFESWRELYLRKYEEREKKFEMLQSKIAAKEQQKQSEARKSMVAYAMSSLPKPPRDVRRQQARYGTGSGSFESTARAASIMKHENRMNAVGRGPSASAGSSSRGNSSSSSSSAAKIISVPPLMKKAKRFMSKLHR